MRGYSIINGEEIFPAKSPQFVLGKSSSGYTLNYSGNYDPATGQGDWDAWEDATPANEQCIVNGAPEGMFFKLVGNTDSISLTFMQAWYPFER